MPLDIKDAAGIYRASKGNHQCGRSLESGYSPFSSHGHIQRILGVVLQKVDDIRLGSCTLAGVLMIADILVKARVEEFRHDARSALGGFLDPLGVFGRRNRRLSSHDENDKSVKNTSVEVQDSRWRCTHEVLFVAIVIHIYITLQILENLMSEI